MTNSPQLSEKQLIFALREKIADIQTLMEKKSQNLSLTEADTERLIIEPLLSVLGYAPWQFVKRNQDKVTGKYPDYTILPGTEQIWFLEAKRLDHVLGDSDAEQAVNYANNQGAQWAVLTNGRSWYVYDAPARRPLAKKRMNQILNIFSEATAAEVLSSLSYRSMTQNTANLPTKIQSSSQLPLTLSGATKISHVTEDATGQILRAYTFSELAAMRVEPLENHLVDLVLQDGTRIPVKTWLEVFTQSVTIICEKYGLPTMPFSEKDGQKQCFLNTEPNHPSSNHMSNRKLNINGNTVYMHWKGANTSPSKSTRRVMALMAKLEVSSEDIRVVFSENDLSA